MPARQTAYQRYVGTGDLPDLTHNGYDVFFDFDGIAGGDFECVI
jgi:hypothetical protein